MVDHELDELKREFLAEAQEKVREMQTTIDERADQESYRRLAYLAHQLKGSGGSYGYQSISVDAAELEKAAESLTDGSAPDSAAQEIRRFVVNLGTEIERHARELGA